MIVLDTSALSAVMHGDPGAIERLRSVAPRSAILVAPVAAEIRYGLERLAASSRRRRLLEREYVLLRATLRWEDWTEAAADEYGRQKALLEKAGTPVDDFDVLIGAAALAIGARVATRNARHFARIRGLSVDDWS